MIVGGALFGAAAYFMPFFLIKALLIILLLGTLFRLFGRRRHYSRYTAFADKIRSMSDEEYAAFKSQWHGHCHPASGAQTKATPTN